MKMTGKFAVIIITDLVCLQSIMYWARDEYVGFRAEGHTYRHALLIVMKMKDHYPSFCDLFY